MRRSEPVPGRDRTSSQTQPQRGRTRSGGQNSRSARLPSLHRSVGNQGVQSLVENGSGDHTETGPEQGKATARLARRPKAKSESSTKEGPLPGAESVGSRSVRRTSDETPLNGKERTKEQVERPTIQRRARAETIQRRLEVSRPNDESEREAERVAEQVVAGGPESEPVEVASGPAIRRQRRSATVIQRSLYDWANEMGEGAEAAFWIGPFDTQRARELAIRAWRETKKLAVGGEHNGPADAFRHAYWNCLMAREIGPEQAKTVAQNHEDWKSGPENERKMDEYNNQVGRDCTPNCYSCVTNKLRTGSGELKIIPDWRGDANESPRQIKNTEVGNVDRPWGAVPIRGF